MAAKNKVIAGDYLKGSVEISWGTIVIKKGFSKVKLTKQTVEEYEVADQDSTKSASSGLLRGLVGGAIGSVGAVVTGGVSTLIGAAAGVVSSKNKRGFVVAIQFKDGKRSLIEIDDKIYKSLMKNLF